MQDYLNIFMDSDFPNFILKYLNTESLQRLKNVTQFCGCDYCSLYSPRFMYTRYDHSLVVAHMTWHFTHNKKETLAALLHDIGTPAFSHTIDYVMGDYINQESSEIKLSTVIKNDVELLNLLKKDNIDIYELDDLSKFHILENKKPALCIDRLDGVLGTCYIWICKNNLDEIKEVYDDLIVLKNESGYDEIGFKSIDIANKFVKMVYDYAIELQGYNDKYVMQYISDVIKKCINNNLFTIDYLYNCKELDLIKIFNDNFKSFKIFRNIKSVINSDIKPNGYYVSFDSKKRNTIPLVLYNNKVDRINKISDYANKLYINYENYKIKKYVYVDEIEEV